MEVPNKNENMLSEKNRLGLTDKIYNIKWYYRPTWYKNTKAKHKTH